MKLRPRDVISYQGRDFLVDGVVTYKLQGKTYSLARATDDDQSDDSVRWIEPLTDDLDDRMLFFKEVRDLSLGTPPPSTISYHGSSYVPRFSGASSVTIEGVVPDRTGTTCDLWRYRAAGDLYLQVEKWPSKTVALAGESVHKDMVQIFPAP
jgi:hypothetical protein